MFRRLIPLALVASLTGCAPTGSADIPVPAQSTPAPVSPPPTPTPTPTFDAKTFSVDDPGSIWIVANKKRPLEPLRHAPADIVTVDMPGSQSVTLRSGAASSLFALVSSALEDDVHLVIRSAYRSFASQSAIFTRRASQIGVERASFWVARPGHSEHQTGLSVDIVAKNGKCAIYECFGDTPEGKWLAEHAWEYGWVLRYPKGLTHITGYMYEPWHWRYVGRGLAAELRKTPNITLEEFFGLPAAPDYAN